MAQEVKEKSKPKTVRLICISDTHNGHDHLTKQLTELYSSEDDILIHCGDMTNGGSLQELTNVKDWLKTLKFKHKIVISGNMDGIGLDTHVSSKKINGKKLFEGAATYLEHEKIEINGIKIFGTPFTPQFVGGFQLQDDKEAQLKWKDISPDTDVLVIHGPPHGYGDLTSRKQHVGCPELANALGLSKSSKKLLNPKVVVFGHVHASYGVIKDKQTDITLINAAQYDGIYHGKKSVKPVVYEYTLTANT